MRSRASRERQFTVVKTMQARAESAYRSKIKDLESSLTDAQTKLNELQRSKADKGGQRFILSPEQQQEIANFRKKESDMKVQLKNERKKLRTEACPHPPRPPSRKPAGHRSSCPCSSRPLASASRWSATDAAPRVNLPGKTFLATDETRIEHGLKKGFGFSLFPVPASSAFGPWPNHPSYAR